MVLCRYRHSNSTHSASSAAGFSLGSVEEGVGGRGKLGGGESTAAMPVYCKRCEVETSRKKTEAKRRDRRRGWLSLRASSPFAAKGKCCRSSSLSPSRAAHGKSPHKLSVLSRRHFPAAEAAAQAARLLERRARVRQPSSPLLRPVVLMLKTAHNVLHSELPRLGSSSPALLLYSSSASGAGALRSLGGTA
jgi:hypothetical protein